MQPFWLGDIPIKSAMWDDSTFQPALSCVPWSEHLLVVSCISRPLRRSISIVAEPSRVWTCISLIQLGILNAYLIYYRTYESKLAYKASKSTFAELNRDLLWSRPLGSPEFDVLEALFAQTASSSWIVQCEARESSLRDRRRCLTRHPTLWLHRCRHDHMRLHQESSVAQWFDLISLAPSTIFCIWSRTRN